MSQFGCDDLIACAGQLFCDINQREWAQIRWGVGDHFSHACIVAAFGVSKSRSCCVLPTPALPSALNQLAAITADAVQDTYSSVIVALLSRHIRGSHQVESP